jgi:hypothetical protein
MKKLLYTLAVFIATLVTMDACTDMCGNQVIEEVRSPNKKLKAIIFTRDCGATTGFSTQLSIIENDDQLENETGNTFILSDKAKGPVFDNGGSKIRVTWTDNNTLIVYFDKTTYVGRQKAEVDDVKIHYELLVE